MRAETGLTSTSLDRAPGPATNFVRGKSGYVPFWPGGLDGVDSTAGRGTAPAAGLHSIAPGFTRGLHFPDDDSDAILKALDIDVSLKSDTEVVSS